jgi:hypothetical protein
MPVTKAEIIPEAYMIQDPWTKTVKVKSESPKREELVSLSAASCNRDGASPAIGRIPASALYNMAAVMWSGLK